MSLLTKSDLLKKAVRRYQEFTLTIGGDQKTCRIQSLNEKERSDYEAATESAKTKAAKAARWKDSKRRLIVLCVVDADGNLILNMADITQLENVDSHITSTIFSKCIEHVGFTDEDVEVLAGNSEDINAG